MGEVPSESTQSASTVVSRVASGECLVPGASVPLSNVNNNSVFPKGVLVSLTGDNIVKAPSRASGPGQGLNNCLALIKDV